MPALHDVYGILHELCEGAFVQEGLLYVVLTDVLHHIYAAWLQRLPQYLHTKESEISVSQMQVVIQHLESHLYLTKRWCHSSSSYTMKFTRALQLLVRLLTSTVSLMRSHVAELQKRHQGLTFKLASIWLALCPPSSTMMSYPLKDLASSTISSSTATSS